MKTTKLTDFVRAALTCEDVEISNEMVHYIQMYLEKYCDHYGITICNKRSKYTPTEIVEYYLEQIEGDDKMNELQKDWISFNHSLAVYNALVKHNLDDCGYKSETKDITLEAIVNIEEIAKKYGVYGNEWETCSDYLNDYVIPRLQNYFKEQNGGFNMPVSDVQQATLSELRELDEDEIRAHFKRCGTDHWIFDHDLQKWFNLETNQTIREYLLDNIETALSPDLLKDFTSELLWHIGFDHILDELTNMQLLSTITSHKVTNKNHTVYMIGERINITPKQWRKIIDNAVERFVRRDE